ncbi:MAG TPA: hypothetical protein VM076_14240 [Gemmatimonadaceae bacterium]|nr:hypothetical protein [Gemmatimonadaceae bacterium]
MPFVFLTLEKCMRAMLLVLVAGLLGVSMTRSLGAQTPAPPKAVAIHIPDSAHVQVVRLRDGSSIVGRITEIGADTVRFAASAGMLSIAKADITSLQDVATSSVRKGGEVWPANPNATRLLFAPTGRMLEKGEGYFNDTYLFLLSVHGGISSRFSLGGGLSVLPLDDFTDNALYIMPKVGVYASPKLNVAVGGLAGVVGGAFDDDQNAGFGILYAAGTAGSPDQSVTFGTGLAYAGGDFADRPVLMLGADMRLGRRVSFVTENYLIPNDDVNGVVSYGLRFFGEKLSADLAFWNAPGEKMVFPGIPYVSFSVKF